MSIESLKNNCYVCSGNEIQPKHYNATISPPHVIRGKSINFKFWLLCSFYNFYKYSENFRNILWQSSELSAILDFFFMSEDTKFFFLGL